jgi:zinc transport system substrate-binding protein
MKYITLLVFFTLSIFAKLNVALSIPPQEFILQKIAPNISYFTLVTPGNSPHTYEPKPSQMIKISKANLYFAIGVEFENIWLNKFKAQNKNLIVIKTDKNITKIPMANKKAKKLDPHIWLNTDNLKIIATNMANALIKYDSKNSKIYKQNLEKFINECDNLKKIINNKLKNLKNRKFLVFHPSWGYFAKEFNLTQIAIEVEGKSPSPKELIKILNFAKEQKVKAIFTQPEFSQKSAKLIANELNIKVVALSPLSRDIFKNLLKITNILAESK